MGEWIKGTTSAKRSLAHTAQLSKCCSTNDDQTELFPHSARRDWYKECIYELGDKLKSVHVHFDLRK